jgi:hypothetical protein
MINSVSVNLIQFADEIQKETRSIEKISLKKTSSSIFFRCFSAKVSREAMESLVIRKIESVARCISENAAVEEENSSELRDYVCALESFKDRCIAVIGLESFAESQFGSKIMEEISRLGMFRESKYGYLLEKVGHD